MFKLTALFLALVACASANPLLENLRNGRIVGGSGVTSPSAFPYQVSLRTNANFHFCGGSIISPTFALTAAHCIVNRAQNAVRVHVGHHMRSQATVFRQSNRIRPHPDYNAQWISNDVGVVGVEAPFPLGPNVAIIALGSAFVGGGINAVVTGWGGTAVTGGPAPDQLQALTTTTLTNEDCRARHTTNNAQFVFDHKICTFTQAGQGICQGDSGGPLTNGGMVHGVVSWNIPCARGWPDAFDRVHYFRSWIVGNTDDLD